MSKILICYRVNEHTLKLSGVFQKFLGQVKGFLLDGHQVYGAFMSYDAMHLVHFKTLDDIQLIAESGGISIADERQLFWHKLKSSFSQHELHFDIAYLRYDPMYNGDAFCCFLEFCKARNTKVVVEFPTYPYELEVKDKQALEIDYGYRQKLHRYVDLLTSTSTSPDIDGFPYFQFNNRVDVESVRLLRSFDEHKFNPKKLRLLSIAYFSPWHGYDRLIRGMANYKKRHLDCPVELHLVGSGETELELQQLVKKLSLEEHVVFHGALVGDELLPFYLHADVGVSSLALHRIGLTDACPLKARGYLCNGLPVIYSYNDKDMLNISYSLRLQADDSDIDLESVLQFAKDCYRQDNPREYIAQHAAQFLNWQDYCKQVIKKLEALPGDRDY